MKEISFCTGGGGGVYASKILGHSIEAYVEQDHYCQQIIEQRMLDGVFDKAPLFSDMRAFDGTPFAGKIDLLSAGLPCQPFSVAGKRKGSSDDRNLWPEMLRITNEIRPRYLFLENVPGLLSSGYFETILKELFQSGYDAKWCVLAASRIGAHHRRKRLWILAYANSSDLREQSRRSESERSSSHVSREYGSQGIVARQKVRSWFTEPALGRVADGVADRSKQLKVLGNGQVPLCAAFVFRLLVRDTERNA